MHLTKMLLIAMLADLISCGASSVGQPMARAGGGPIGFVTIGTGIQFVSTHNGTMNPAVDTIPTGSTITWKWTGSLPHSVQSTETPSFQSSETRTGSGTYTVTFANPGTYHYDCAVHGGAMTGTVVVLSNEDLARRSALQTASR
jgi:plastocyanin